MAKRSSKTRARWKLFPQRCCAGRAARLFVQITARDRCARGVGCAHVGAQFANRVDRNVICAAAQGRARRRRLRARARQCWRAPLRGTDFGSGGDPYRQKDYVEPEELKSKPVYRLILAGDAGSAIPNDPTLALLGKWGDADPKRTAVIYLGDNLYPAGLQEGDRPRGERVLRQQIEATSARKIFIPGNHDWGYTATQRIGARRARQPAEVHRRARERAARSSTRRRAAPARSPWSCCRRASGSRAGSP